MVRRRARRAQVAAWAVLAVGLAVLVATVAAAVVGHNRTTDADAAKLEAQRLRFARLLQEADRVPPRVEVSYVEFRLSDLRSLTTANSERPAYQLVSTEVSERLRTGRPPLRPDFGSILRTPESDVLSRGFREGRVRERPPWLVALLVTPTTPGRTRFRLTVERLATSTSFEVYDLADLVVQSGLSESLPERRLEGVETHGTETVAATIDAGSAGALVPLALLHRLSFLRNDDNADLLDANHGGSALQIATGAALSPRRLFLRRPGGSEVEVAILDALQLPLRLEAVGRN